MMRAVANHRGRRAIGALRLGTRQRVFLQFAALALLSSLLASCATPKDVQHHVVISVKDQKLALLDREKLVATYPVSPGTKERRLPNMDSNNVDSIRRAVW